jgi:hypothetical protein
MILGRTHKGFFLAREIFKGADSMKVEPFHSKLQLTRVHHNNNECRFGNNVRSYNRKPGTGGFPLCLWCRRINERKK